MLDQPASKTELLHHISAERAALMALIEGLRPDEQEAPALADGLSVKDVLAHISVWERRITTAIEAAIGDEVPAWPETGATLADVDLLNARDLETHRPDTLAAVLRESRASHDMALRTVESLGEDVIMAAPRWRPSVPLVHMIGANTWEHYREHIDQIEAWLEVRRT